MRYKKIRVYWCLNSAFTHKLTYNSFFGFLWVGRVDTSINKVHSKSYISNSVKIVYFTSLHSFIFIIHLLGNHCHPWNINVCGFLWYRFKKLNVQIFLTPEPFRPINTMNKNQRNTLFIHMLSFIHSFLHILMISTMAWENIISSQLRSAIL